MIQFEKRSDMVQALTPSLAVKDADAMIAFYEKAFGAELNYAARVPTTHHVMHASIRIGGYDIYLHERFPETCSVIPFRTDCTGGCIHMQVTEGVDELYERAVAAGAKPIMPPTDMFWGDRFAVLEDPSGHNWTLGMLIPNPPQIPIEELLRQLGMGGSG